jgi:hypothetical protein
MSKKISTTNDDITVTTGIALVVRVGSFKFVKEEDYPWIDIFMIGNENDELLEQEDSDKANEIIDLTDLKIFALNWVFDNVEITKESMTS